MKDVDTKQEISFYPNNASFLEQNGSKDVAEVAAVLPNKPPLTGKCINNITMYTVLNNQFVCRIASRFRKAISRFIVLAQ